MGRTMTEWGLNVYGMCKRYGITQDELAKEYGCGRTFLSNKLLRSSSVKPCTKERLEAALDRLIAERMEAEDNSELRVQN